VLCNLLYVHYTVYLYTNISNSVILYPDETGAHNLITIIRAKFVLCSTKIITRASSDDGQHVAVAVAAVDEGEEVINKVDHDEVPTKTKRRKSSSNEGVVKADATDGNADDHAIVFPKLQLLHRRMQVLSMSSSVRSSQSRSSSLHRDTHQKESLRRRLHHHNKP
jgi:hypothetical protein